jgi:hypothetical protein
MTTTTDAPSIALDVHPATEGVMEHINALHVRLQLQLQTEEPTTGTEGLLDQAWDLLARLERARRHSQGFDVEATAMPTDAEIEAVLAS